MPDSLTENRHSVRRVSLGKHKVKVRERENTIRQHPDETSPKRTLLNNSYRQALGKARAKNHRVPSVRSLQRVAAFDPNGLEAFEGESLGESVRLSLFLLSKHIGHFLAKLERPVLGGIETDFCK